MRRRLDFLHPSNARLRQWLDTGDPDGIGQHVEQCERCADRLEQIDLAGVPPLPLDGASPLRQALNELLAPPSDLADRVVHGVELRRRSDQEFALIAGLFSVGVETAQLVFDPGSRERHHTEGHPHNPDRHDVDHGDDHGVDRDAEPQEDDRP